MIFTRQYKVRGKKWQGLILVSVLTFVGIQKSFTQTDGSQSAFAGSAQSTARAGIMVSGELWDSFLPPNVGPYHGEASEPIIGHLLRMGNFDRVWTTPTHLWPGGWTNGNFWSKDMFLAEFNPDTTWNPPTIGGAPNPAFRASSGSKYALASFKSTVAGAGDPARNYTREARWLDPQKRHHAVYEAGWPTNIGVDVKLKIHQFALNWNNFNDFIIVEISLTNTGNVDINADGVVERTGNVIRALSLLANGEFMCSYFLGRSGGREGNRFGAARAIGYIGDPDPTGAPWDMMVGFPGESAAGLRDMGLNDFPLRFYTDIWSAWSWISVKRGSTGALHQLPDKETIYGTHAIGVGPERGWYASGGQGRGLNIRATSFNDPRSVHTAAMGTWYRNGGKSRDGTLVDRSPNPNFFESGVTGDPTTFVPKQTPTRPNGDRKLLSGEQSGAFEVNHYENAWTKGFTGLNNFDGDMFSGIGPFSLEVGETITVVWVEAGGYRLEGVQNAIAAARWAFENNYTLPEYPAVPEMAIENTLTKSVRIRWDDRGERHSNFAGYKIYKASAARQIDWLSGGMRELDEYWRNMVPGPVPREFLDPVNSEFSAHAFVAGRNGITGSWGPYELVAVFPAAQLGSVADPSVGGFNYSWEDRVVDLGFRYWYYVAAYTSEPIPINLGPRYSGTNNPVTSVLETPNINRNGASGLWQGTYPFADLNSFYPKSAAGLKAIGAGFVVKSSSPTTGSLLGGAAQISVKPNPYKKKALFDSAIDPFDHKVMFYNLPQQAKIAILDVSGQIVQEIDFQSNDPNNGSVFWDLFSKDGIEVASGLYIYVVQYQGGQHLGYLSILR